MSNIPDDPRELARAILSGKISLEDVARHKQRMTGASPSAPAPAAPRVAASSTFGQAESVRPVSRPVQRQTPPMVKKQGVRPVPSSQRSASSPQRVVRKIEEPPRSTLATPAPPLGESLSAVVSPMEKVSPKGQTPTVLKGRAALRQAVVMAEVLGKPVGMRGNS